jgi:hypothetical protein
MDKPISVGDLVMVMRQSACICPNESKIIGHVFTVTNLRVIGGLCQACGRPLAIANVAIGHSGGGDVEVSRLKRIPPLEELDDVKKDEEITV